MPITKSDLMYSYPEELVATHPQHPPRVLFKALNQAPKEIDFCNILDLFAEGDVLIINKTQVLPRRLFINDFDILFLESEDGKQWTVLFPAKQFKIGDEILLPEDIKLTLTQKGRPQKVVASKSLTSEYFQKYGDFALPPYIQQARGFNKPQKEDKAWYQTQWGSEPGSLAAPTASLHFKNEDLEKLKAKIKIVEVTLHVGLGTFLPITSENLAEHTMHSEFVSIPKASIKTIHNAKENQKRIWALGTTSMRSIEAFANGHLQETDTHYLGFTNLFIKPGDPFLICDGLLTNFHQPGSTLISLVGAFAGLDEVKKTYAWAIENRFRLFSYGDLSIWTK